MAADTSVIPIPKSRTLYLTDQVTQKSIGDLTKSILEINEDDSQLEKIYAIHSLKYERKPIKIYIDSYGGYVYQCFGLLSIMESSETPIHTIATGAAMSCGFMILICGHKRFGYKLCTPMYHQVSSWAAGKVQDMKEDRLQKIIEEITLKRTKIKKEKLEKIREKKHDWFMTAEQAVKNGVLDEIL